MDELIHLYIFTSSVYEVLVPAGRAGLSVVSGHRVITDTLSPLHQSEHRDPGEQNTGGVTARPAHPALTGCRAENSKLLSKLNHEYMDLHNTHCTFHINVVEG